MKGSESERESVAFTFSILTIPSGKRWMNFLSPLRRSYINGSSLLCHHCGWKGRGFSSSSEIDVFDRQVKTIQKSRAAVDENSKNFDFLREEVAKRLVDRLDVCLMIF